MIGFFLAEVALAVAVGTLAQRWKGRTGAVWALLAFVVQMLTLSFAIYSADKHAPGLLDTSEGVIVAHLMAMASGAVMALVVATLPKR